MNKTFNLPCKNYFIFALTMFFKLLNLMCNYFEKVLIIMTLQSIQIMIGHVCIL